MTSVAEAATGVAAGVDAAAMNNHAAHAAKATSAVKTRLIVVKPASAGILATRNSGATTSDVTALPARATTLNAAAAKVGNGVNAGAAARDVAPLPQRQNRANQSLSHRASP